MGAYCAARRDKPTGFTLIFSCAAFGLRGGMLGFRVPKSGRRTAAVQKLAQVRERGNSRQRLGVRLSPLPLSLGNSLEQLPASAGGEAELEAQGA